MVVLSPSAKPGIRRTGTGVEESNLEIGCNKGSVGSVGTVARLTSLGTWWVKGKGHTTLPNFLYLGIYLSIYSESVHPYTCITQAVLCT